MHIDENRKQRRTHCKQIEATSVRSERPPKMANQANEDHTPLSTVRVVPRLGLTPRRQGPVAQDITLG